MTTKLRVHGTYPHDGGRWKTIENRLPLDRVAELLGVEVTEEQVEQHSSGEWSGCVYLWLNKGFVLIDRPDLQGTSSDGNLGLACMEMLGGSPEVKGIKSGDRAVYLHDGTYSLIERA